MAARTDSADRGMPAADPEAFIEAQQRMIGAWREASLIMADATQTVLRRQTELVEEGMRALLADREGMLGMGSGEYRPGEQLERLHEVYRLAFGGFQELGDIVLKAQLETVRVLTDGAAGAGEAVRKAA